MPIALLVFFATFFALAFFWPTFRLWRRDGVNALVLPYDDTAYGLVGKWFRATLIAVFALLIALSLGLPDRVLGQLRWLEQSALQKAGWALLILSLVLIVAAQAQMGASWRIGIDKDTPTPLVTRGIFARSRNPIFLGMRASLLGLFLVLPSGMTLAIFLLGEVLMQVQVRLEETHLLGLHGNSFEQYRQSVRRWF